MPIQAKVIPVLDGTDGPRHERDLKRPPIVPLPSTGRLSAGLGKLLAAARPAGTRLEVLTRTENVHTSSYQSEIVRCQIGGSQVDLLCKYSGDPRFERSVRRLSHGHRGGVRYEAEVYQHQLQALDLPTPVFHGQLELLGQDRICLVIGFVDKALRVTKVPVETGVGRAARHLARFHSKCIDSHRWPGLFEYDLDYFVRWPSLASRSVARLGLEATWWIDLVKRYEARVASLLTGTTLIHGEFYPKNILARDDSILVLDWETAAVAAGEIDLASLIEGWDEDVAGHCVREYQRTRWPGGPPAEFETRLQTAQAYWYFRWLSRSSGAKSASSRIDSLRRMADLWGLR